MKIYTLTPNPALDLSGHAPALVPNEKNYVVRTRRDPGGNGVNVARVAHRLGARAEALGFLGGPAGAELARLLDAEGLAHSFTAIRGSTRTNVTVTNDADHRQTRLTFPGPKVTPAERRALRRKVRSLGAPALLVMGGSLPEGCPDSYYAELGAAAKRGLIVILDCPVKQLRASFRPGFRPWLIKPNIAELEELSGRKLRAQAAVLDAGRALLRHADHVCVSLGGKGALLISARGTWRGISPRVKAKGAVGAGDSMVGAMAFRLAQDRAISEQAILEAFAWGLAAGAASAESEGTAMATARRIRALKQKVKIEKL